MILYVRQEAYYNAVPDGCKISRAEEIDNLKLGKSIDIQKISEVDSDEQMIEEQVVPITELQEIPMPEIPAGAEYLVAFLHSAGTALATGMGLVGLTWQEIEAWARCTGNIDLLTPQDMSIIYLLSKVYARESYQATLKGAKPPYVKELEVEDLEEVREKVASKAEDIFSSMIARQKGK